MADDKIRISWDEVQSAQVDAHVEQAARLLRAQQHVAQQPLRSAGIETPLALGRPTSFWYSTLVYLSLLGLVGSFIGWGCGELLFKLVPNHYAEYAQAFLSSQAATESFKRGEITESQLRSINNDLERQLRSNPYLVVLQDPNLSDSQKTQRFNELMDSEAQRQKWLSGLLWMSIIAIPLATSLAIGEPLAVRNWTGVVINGSVGAALGLIGGTLVGLFINELYQALGGGAAATSLGQQVFARAVGWSILGMFLAIAPGLVLKNWKRLTIGLVGGLIGGLIGGLFFDPIAMVSNVVLSRFVAILAIGVFSGLSTGLIENAAKSGWLRVVAGLIAGKQFVIYKNPTYVGSSPQSEIYLFKDPQVGARHAAIHLVAGGYVLEDLQSPTGTRVDGQLVGRVRLRNGQQLQIGSTVLVFQEKPRSSMA